MNFNHCPPKELSDLSSEMLNGKRFYVTPEGKFPSITSVLGSFPKEGLIEWRRNVGEDEYKRVMTTASSRGTKLHTLCEHYLQNKEINNKSASPDAFSAFLSIKPILNRINNIHGLEVPLYSKRLKVAGKTDCIGEYENELCLIDFKTSRKEKREEWIMDYFLQATFYSLSYLELTNIKVKKLAIIIAVDDGNPQVFVRDIKDYIKPLVSKIKFYYQNYHV
jgi:genome maintenance exonuclease 1